jgi:hypothetical protein
VEFSLCFLITTGSEFPVLITVLVFLSGFSSIRFLPLGLSHAAAGSSQSSVSAVAHQVLPSPAKLHLLVLRFFFRVWCCPHLLFFFAAGLISFGPLCRSQQSAVRLRVSLTRSSRFFFVYFPAQSAVPSSFVRVNGAQKFGSRKKFRSLMLIAVRVSCAALGHSVLQSALLFSLRPWRPGLSARGVHRPILVSMFPLFCHFRLSSFVSPISESYLQVNPV